MIKANKERVARLEAEAGVTEGEPLTIEIVGVATPDGEPRVRETLIIYPSGRQERTRHDDQAN